MSDWIEALYHRHGGKVFSFLRAMVGDRHAAEDLLQETFARALRAADDFEERAKPSTWLFAIARNLAINHLKVNARRGMTTLEYAAGLPADGADPAETAAGIRDAEMIRAALSSLSDELREVFLMKVIQGLTYREIAGIIGRPIGTAQSRFHRSVTVIRRILRKQGVTNELRSI
ncbi:MAG: RNA polymerase sigma factor [Planctomycetota bacterium]|jgi:RNA polymerase sigma-70 factor (ECF subfamily)